MEKGIDFWETIMPWNPKRVWFDRRMQPDSSEPRALWLCPIVGPGQADRDSWWTVASGPGGQGTSVQQQVMAAHDVSPLSRGEQCVLLTHVLWFWGNEESAPALKESNKERRKATLNWLTNWTCPSLLFLSIQRTVPKLLIVIVEQRTYAQDVSVVLDPI